MVQERGSCNSYSLEPHALVLEGEYDVLVRPQSVTAYSGVCQAGVVPMRSGRWVDALKRFFEPDRFMLRRLRCDGSLWLSPCEEHWVTGLRVDGYERFQVVTERLLCVEREGRCGSYRVGLVPGSVSRSLTVTEVSLASSPSGLPPVVATRSPLNRVVLGEGEVLHVSPSALVGWCGCGVPRSYCARLRMRDLFLPRLPECLTLDFTGPGEVLFEGVARTPSRRVRRMTPGRGW